MTRRLTPLTVTDNLPQHTFTVSDWNGAIRRNFLQEKKRDAPKEDFTEPLADRFARKPVRIVATGVIAIAYAEIPTNARITRATPMIQKTGFPERLWIRSTYKGSVKMCMFDQHKHLR
jgi:hypothetical protein